MDRSPRQLVGGLALLLYCAVAALAQQSARYTGEVQLDFVHTGPASMSMPTAVALGPDGEVYVCDVRQRILAFDSAGQLTSTIAQIGDEPLHHPIGVAVDSTGHIWVTDTAAGRILACTPAGEPVANWPIDPGPTGAVPDITGVACSPDGQTLWAIDNDGHALIRINAANGAQVRLGKHGDALGEFDYPFLLAVAHTGDIVLTDVLNGRGVIFNARGEPVHAIGQYGVEPGELYRPAGIATDAEENIWISDVALGVIQIFGSNGTFLGVLCNADNTPLRFRFPMGLAFDRTGRLYVAELGADRIRRIAIRVDANVPPPATPRTTLASRQPRNCTACHIEWMSPLDQGRPTELVAVPDNPPDDPHVSRADTCLTCHGGTLVDSRQPVWMEHGHQTGIVPPATMTVPARLPLSDGRLLCRTCHSAHTRGGSGNFLRDAVFLRVQKDATELCSACHTEFDAGVAQGMHPLGPMKVAWPVEQLRGQHDSESKTVTCLACHNGHGSRRSDLLALDPETNALCLACHQRVNPDLFGPDSHAVHGGAPVLNDEQRTVAAGFDTRVGPVGELLCMTCHQTHHARHPDYLLAFDPAQQDTCAACHAQQRTVVGSPHDLRTDHPDATNILGMTAEVGGACSGCHTGHRPARPILSTAVDPAGECVNCHSADGLAAAKQLGPVNHPPSAACIVCHNPHETRYGNFLAGQPSDLCAACHLDYNALAGGPHDVAHASPKWPAASTATHDTCLACHRLHGTEATGLFRAGLATGVPKFDAACLECHADADPHTDTKVSLQHTSDATTIADTGTLPIVTADGKRRIACHTCHNPHEAPTIASLLRLTSAAPSPNGSQPASSGPAREEQLCTTCHAAMASINTIGHAPRPLTAAGYDATACGPCHQIHAAADTIDPTILWPRKLGVDAKPSPETSAAADYYCRACHTPDGPAPLPRIASHPDADMFNPVQPGDPAFLPLYNARGEIDPAGRPACPTCHLTHGRTEPAPIAEQLQNLSSREMRARKWHIRTFVGGNVCTTCHGEDALRRFMYFHDPVRRAGPINPQ